MSEPDEEAENWWLVLSPVGEAWSGRARYAAAMYFYRRGEMNAETLEVYRLSSRLDNQDPLSIIRERGIGKDWLTKVEAHAS
ncbi:MAG: hypothetical protein M9924_05165 [Rhizobiaceae bacterium]|nr:hypothetical protein [Rhizobiaceae bacterium]